MSPTWPTLLFAASIAFVFYRRFRRTFGRQPIARRTMIARMGLLSVVSVLLIALLPTVPGILAAIAGALAGVALSRLGLAHTEFENTPTGVVYTSNKWIGLGITALLLGRVGARSVILYQTVAQAQQSGSIPEIHRSPLTLGIYCLLAAYYVGYYSGVLKTARGMEVSATGIAGGLDASVTPPNSGEAS